MIRPTLLALALFASDSCGPALCGEARFTIEPCSLSGVPPELAPRLVCGTVAVPRAFDDPASGNFRLAVVLIKTNSARRQDDSVIYVAGDPGSPLTAKAALLARHEAGVVAPDRDLILVDQRGAGRSEPTLCPDLAATRLDIFAQGAEQRALIERWRDSVGACRREMEQSGLRPEWFGTQITAADIDRVRQALGIDRWNIYALSYGTEVAMTMMALHPQSLRAVVLDSLFLPEPVPITLAQSFTQALNGLFASCERQPACRSTHPDLRTTYASPVRGLDANPLEVPLEAGAASRGMAQRGEVFRLIVDQALYSRAGMSELPAFIEAARNRDAAAMTDMVSRAARNYLASSVGDMAAVECRDRPGRHDSLPSGEPPVSAFVAGLCVGGERSGHGR